MKLHSHGSIKNHVIFFNCKFFRFVSHLEEYRHILNKFFRKHISTKYPEIAKVHYNIVFFK